MTTRQMLASMLYTPNAPARWLRTLASVIDGAPAGLCCEQWQRGAAPYPQPARLATISRLDRPVR